MNVACIHGCREIAHCPVCTVAPSVRRYKPPVFTGSQPLPQRATRLQRLAIAAQIAEKCPGVMDDDAIEEFVAMLDEARVAFKTLGLL